MSAKRPKKSTTPKVAAVNAPQCVAVNGIGDQCLRPAGHKGKHHGYHYDWRNTGGNSRRSS